MEEAIGHYRNHVVRIITNRDVECLLMKCSVGDTLLPQYSCQNVQPESHEKPLDKPKLRDLLEDFQSLCFRNATT